MARSVSSPLLFPVITTSQGLARLVNDPSVQLINYNVLRNHQSSFFKCFTQLFWHTRSSEPRPSKLFILSMSAASGWKSWKYQKWFSNINPFCRTPSLVHLDKDTYTHSNWLWSKRDVVVWPLHYSINTGCLIPLFILRPLSPIRQGVKETWSIQFICWMRIYLDISSFSDLQRNFHKSQSFANVRQKPLF